MTDAHRRFLFDDMPVRGGWVRIDAAYREVLAQHDYPPVLRRMLGELLALESDALLRQLFAELTVRLFAEHGVRFECGCSEERVANALLLLGRNEVEQVLADQRRIAVACEFCNRKYEFDRARALSLFAQPERASTVH